ncbi:MAG TPA: GNAT family N-acetyltransferase [Acidobacteriaceae bacterium]
MNPEMFHTREGQPIVLRACEGFDELAACVELQVQTWGYNDGDVIPRRMFTVAQRIGGQVIGAFDPNQQMIGFAMSLPGTKAAKKPGSPPRPYLHSHMLAVLPPYRNAGIGRRLKLYQRVEALSRGIQLMEWTFDPLEIKNAFLNIHRLGVIVRSYTSNFYGVSSSRLQAGLPTDRLHAEWWMDSARVEAILNDSSPPQLQILETITVPKAVSKWKAASVSQALALQTENRRRFESAFARGLTVTGFRVDSEGNGMFELARLQEPVTGLL